MNSTFVPNCCHCGKPLADGMFLNAWLMAYECRPKCNAGLEWYEVNTMRTAGGLIVCQEREAAVLEMRRAKATVCPERPCNSCNMGPESESGTE
jgi:hypothetical protein